MLLSRVMLRKREDRASRPGSAAPAIWPVLATIMKTLRRVGPAGWAGQAGHVGLSKTYQR
jgi:hypothetical protein